MKKIAALMIGALALPLAAAPYRALNPDSLISGNPKKTADQRESGRR